MRPLNLPFPRMHGRILLSQISQATLPMSVSTSLPTLLSPLALWAALVAPATGQAIETVSPDEGTLGTVLTVTGDGFGDKKPKAFLRDPVSGKKYALKITANADGELTAEIKKAVAGALDLVVIPKGSDEIVAAAAFEVLTPQVLMLLDGPGGDVVTQAAGGDTFVAVGNHFGPKKGRVRVGGKAAKVVSWEPNGLAPSEGLEGATDMAVIQMPKSLANGLWPLEFSNKIGVDDSAEIIMTGSTKKLGKLFLDISLGGEKVNFKLSKPADIPQAGVFTLYGTTKTNPSKTLTVIVPFDIANDMAPETLQAGVLSLLNASFIETGKVSAKQVQQGQLPKMAIYSAGLGNGSLTVQINASSGGQVAGTITGLLNKQSDSFSPPKPGTLEIEGSFVVQP